MLNISGPTVSREIDVKEQETYVELPNDHLTNTQVVLASVPKLLQGVQGQPKAECAQRQTTLNFPMQSLLSELSNLLSKYDEYHDSETYLTRIAGLASLVGDWSQAYKFAEEALQLNDSAEYRYRLAEIVANMDDVERAQNEWNSLAIEGHLPSILRLAELSVSKNDFSGAYGWIEKARCVDSADWRVHMITGSLDLISGRYQQAVHNFRSAREEKGNSVSLYYNLAITQILSGQVNHALKSLRIAVGLNPFSRKALIAWADLSSKSKQLLPEVSKAVARYLAYFSDDKLLTNRLALIYYVQHDFSRSREVLDQAKARFDDPSIWNNLGVLAITRHDWNSALGSFRKAIETATRHGQHSQERTATIVTANLVGVLNKMAQFGETAKIAESYIASTDLRDCLVGESSYRIPEALVRAQLELGNATSAIKMAEGWVRTVVHPRLRVSLANTLVCYFSLVEKNLQKAHELAMLAYETQMNDDMRDDELWKVSVNNLAYVCIEDGKLEDAGQYLARLHGPIDRGKQYVFATRGFLALRLGQLERGKNLYKNAISVTNNQATKNLFRLKLNWELAQYWARAGDKSRALRLARRVQKVSLKGVWTLPFIKREAGRLEAKLKKIE